MNHLLVIWYFFVTFHAAHAHDAISTDFKRPSYYEIPEVWTDLNAVTIFHQIEWIAGDIFIKERREYLTEVQHKGMQIQQRLLEKAQDEMEEMKEDITLYEMTINNRDNHEPPQHTSSSQSHST